MESVQSGVNPKELLMSGMATMLKIVPAAGEAFATRICIAVLLGCSLVLAGCRIPGLRAPDAGQPTPEGFNWNNGRPFWSPQPIAKPLKKNEESEDAKQQDDSKSDDKNPEPAEPAIKQISFQSPVQSQPSVSGDTSSDGQILDLPSDEPVEFESQTVSSYPTQPDFETLTVDSSAQLPHDMFFNDPYLVDLIQQSLIGNQELKILSEEIRIACNEVYARSGEYRPFVSLGTGAGIDKAGEFTRFGAVEDQLEVAPGRAFPDPLPDFLTAANVSWEVDIWNRMRNAQRAASMRYLGTQEGRNYVITRLVAEISENYYTLLALDSRLAALDRTIEIQRQSLKIAEAKKDAIGGTSLAVQRFQAEVRKNEAEKTVLMQEMVQIENRINFLLGRYPQPIERSQLDFNEVNLETLIAGIPSQLLLQRADIRQAEREVEAAGLDVQVARARFYPSLNLTAGLGWNAFSTGYLLKTPESLVYSLAGELVGPLINKRAIKAAYCSANAAQLQSIYNYQQTVLQAHIEVVNQMTKVENYKRTIEVKKQQIESLEASVASANSLFQNARAEYVEVLLAQREMMEARMQLIEIKREQLSAVVNAYQALGGGAF
ncbi:MAG: TolC family protein [Pirellulaceae bacterium]